MTQQLARVFEAAIGRHPQEWRILRKVFVAGLDPDRLAQLRRNRDAAGQSPVREGIAAIAGRAVTVSRHEPQAGHPQASGTVGDLRCRRPTGVFERRRMQTKGGPQRRSGAAGVVHGVPWWGVVSSVVAPVLLVSGWTIAAGLQRGSYSAVADTVSVLAADGAADRWVMTLAFLVAGACEVVTGLALRPAASAGRLILMVGGLAGLLVASSPEPAGGGGSARHTFGAVVGLVALAAWPVAAQQRGPSVPWGLRPVVSASTSVVLLVVLLWFGAELVTGGGQAGLAERLLGGMQTLWPVLVILSCRRRTGPSPDRSGTRWLAAAFLPWSCRPGRARIGQRTVPVVSHKPAARREAGWHGGASAAGR